MKRIAIIIMSVLLLAGCQKSNKVETEIVEDTPSAPQVVTYGYKQTNKNTVFCVGYITNEGTNEITEYGICYCQNSSSVIDMQRATRAVTILKDGEMTAVIPDVKDGVEYVYCAFASNAAGTTYGNTKAFKIISCANSINDFVGKYTVSCTNAFYKTSEQWNNVQVLSIGDTLAKVTNLGHKSAVDGWSAFNVSAYGKYDSVYHCILLANCTYDESCIVTKPVSVGGITIGMNHYALFTPIYLDLDNKKFFVLSYSSGYSEIALVKKSDGTLAIVDSPYSEDYCRHGNAYTFGIYDLQMNFKEYRSQYTYMNTVFNKSN